MRAEEDLMRNACVAPDWPNRMLGHAGAGVRATYGRAPEPKMLTGVLGKVLNLFLTNVAPCPRQDVK
jgi:hypothetical protein